MLTHYVVGRGSAMNLHGVQKHISTYTQTLIHTNLYFLVNSFTGKLISELAI